MFVIGTAGHVDHGKSTLIEALTGIDPDRLAEEKEREMTIDLGFAWVQLAENEEEIGIVDVPGHRDFIENMLAGIGGIDLALFVVAADEGVMPQTKEHLDILDLLEVSGGIIVLTKVDLIDDPDWLELVTLDVSEAVTGTILADAPILPVSAKTGQGLTELRQLLREKLSETPARPDNGRPRLAIDRVFSLAGFGTVVTGTLIDGRFRIGDAVEIQPGNRNGRIRGLQTHKTKRDVALPGSRVAINLTGIEKDATRRGNVVAAPGIIRDTILLDVAYRHLPGAPGPLKHNTEVKFFVGATEVLARARVLGSKQIEPGTEGWLQLALSEPIATLRGDRFILRRPSPGQTLGGGKVLDPHPGRRHRRFRQDVIDRLQTLARGTPAELMQQRLNRLEPASQESLLKESGLDREAAISALAELQATDQVIVLDKQIMTMAGWHRLQDLLLALISQFHKQFPLRLGIPREEVRSRLKLKQALFNALVEQMEENGQIRSETAVLRQADHQIRFTPAQEAARQSLLTQFARAGVNSPSIKEAKQIAGEDVYFAMVDSGSLQPLNNDVVYAKNEYDKFTKAIITFLQKQGSIDAAQARDILQTSRKYAIALLEHLDEKKLTRRVGDKRELA